MRRESLSSLLFSGRIEKERDEVDMGRESPIHSLNLTVTAVERKKLSRFIDEYYLHYVR